MLDLIIPVYKNSELTRRCIESIVIHLDEITKYSPRLIVINDSPDDSSTVDTLNALARNIPDIILLTNKVNMGFVKTVNLGLRMALNNGHDALIINSDTETFSGTLRELVLTAEADPLIGFVSPRSNNASIASLPHIFGGYPASPQEAYDRWVTIAPVLPRYHFVPTAVGFYLLIKGRVLADVGLLCEDFGEGYEEENELIQRANRVGYRAILANHAFAYHAGSASFSISHLNLHQQRASNLTLITERYPEFLPQVHEYEESRHFRAEHMLSQLVPPKSGKLGLCIDLSEMGCHHNGTNELTVGVVNALFEDPKCPFDIALLCSEQVFRFHGFQTRHGFRRASPENPGRYAISLRLGQPFNQHHLELLETLAPINVYGMLDTIALDVGVINREHHPDQFWQHISRHANGLFFISEFARQTFINRYPHSIHKPHYTRLLPTRLSEYRKNVELLPATHRDHILVLGNHYPHKYSDATAEIIRQAYPNQQVVVIGSETFSRVNLQGWRSGTIDQGIVDDIFLRASIVVLPSYVEGFGFGLLHALARRKPVVARNIPATLEILSTFGEVRGVYLYSNNKSLQASLRMAFDSNETSYVNDANAYGWSKWTQGLIDFCYDLVARQDVFNVQCERMRESDLMHAAISESVACRPNSSRLIDIKPLLRYEQEEFLKQAYLQILGRPVDAKGFAHYLTLLQWRFPKLLILIRLLSSREGRLRGCKVRMI